MEDLLIEVLSQFGYPVIRQGSLTEDEDYPDHFFTYWNNDTFADSSYDNAEFGTAWDFSVNFYSIDTANCYDKLIAAIAALKGAGFSTSGKGYDIPSGEPSHDGRGTRVLYLEQLQTN